MPSTFVTWNGRSRRVLSTRWNAGQKNTAPVIAPVSAWITRPRPCRKPLKRRLQASPALKWQYIAPTIAPLLRVAKVKRIEFRQKLRVASPLILSIPPTGPPPFSAWAVRPVKRVAWNRKLIRVADLQTYPQTQVTASDSRTTAVPFQTRHGRSRKALRVTWTPVASVAPPIVTTFVEPPKAIKRKATHRSLLKVRIAPVYPVATPGTSPAVPAALIRPQVRRRKSSGVGFVSVDVLFYGINQFPKPVQPKTLYRRDVVRKLQSTGWFAALTRQIVVSVAAVSAFAAKKALERRGTHRKLRIARIAPVYPATPAVPAQPLAAFIGTKGIKRRTTERVVRVALVAPVNPVAAVVPPVAAWFVVKTNRISHKRKLLAVIPVYARIAASAFSLAAIDLKTVYRRHTKPRKVWHLVGQEQVAPGLQSGGWIVYPSSHRTVNPSGNRTVRPSR